MSSKSSTASNFSPSDHFKDPFSKTQDFQQIIFFAYQAAPTVTQTYLPSSLLRP